LFSRYKFIAFGVAFSGFGLLLPMLKSPHIIELIAGIVFLFGLVCVVWEFIGDPILVVLT
jgi:hypothetical protein